MANKKDCFKGCLKGMLPFWVVLLVLGLIGVLIVASGGQVIVLGIILASTLASVGIAVSAAAATAYASCLIACFLRG